MKGLGKGLDALLGGAVLSDPTQVRMVSVYSIDNNTEQPRKLFNEEKLKELVGHTPLQVGMGACLGTLIGVLAGIFWI